MNDECYVLGNGPSLAKIDNLILDSLPTFGSNRIYLKYVPTYYCCINPTEARKYPKEIEVMESTKFVTNKVPIKGCTPLKSTNSVQFSTNPYWAVQEGYSVTYVLLQLAFFFGFRTVYLLGVDHHYEDYKGKPNQLIKWRGKDPNHFTEDYLNDNDEWNCPDLKKSEFYYRIAKQVFEGSGRKIINLTENSELDVFEKGRL